jgi:hypothetical protein
MMKNLLKLLVLMVVLSIFAFSENQTIIKVRNYTEKNGKILYDKGADVLKTSKNQYVASVGKIL